jgi:hypothetical protein
MHLRRIRLTLGFFVLGFFVLGSIACSRPASDVAARNGVESDDGSLAAYTRDSLTPPPLPVLAPRPPPRAPSRHRANSGNPLASPTLPPLPPAQAPQPPPLHTVALCVSTRGCGASQRPGPSLAPD